MDTTLVILAAGLGSRFHGGVKQLTPVGPCGECLLAYSVYDALAAGFNEIVFVIRREIEARVRDLIGTRLEARCGTDGLRRVSYVYQEQELLPAGFDAAALCAAREKPWGTGQALLCCRGTVRTPFAVINSDDYYGKQSFRDVHAFLCAHGAAERQCCMAGFVLGHTLSPHGSVNRGVCELAPDGSLRRIREVRGLHRENGKILCGREEFAPETPVSMNFWGFAPDFLDTLEADFARFLRTADLKTDEYLLPEIVADRLAHGTLRAACLKSEETWFGVTYAEDRAEAERKIMALIRSGDYPERLF